MALASSSSLGADISTSPQVPQPNGAALFSPNSRAIAGFGSPAGDVFRSASVCVKSTSSSGRWSSGHLTDGPDSPRKDITIGAAIAVSEDGNGYVGADVSPLVICFGEMLIDFVPTASGISLAEAPAFKKAPGGAPANVAVGIARLGGRSAFIGKVGQDEFGYMLADILRQNNVEDRGIRFDPAARTALAFVTLRSDGEREFMFYRNPSADMLLHETELDDHLIKEATIFHYGSISLITEPCKTAHMSAMKKAKEAGALLSYDPNLRLPLWPSEKEAREGILSIWNEADVIKVSEDEIAFLTEGGDPYSDEIAMQFMHSNLKLLLVTEGKNGCRYYTKDFKGRVDGMRVETVDTTGAGDAFVAGLLSQLVSDLSLLEDESRLRYALMFANGCGAITTTERGAIPALPDREAVLNLIRNCEVLA